MVRAIPPLNPLRVFEAVARLGSFTRAADELHVSQSAVSRQVSLLEDYLDVKLFNRELRGVSLTEIGCCYRREIGPAFSRIAMATQDLLAKSRGAPVKVRAYTTFAAKWLLPRLPTFQAANPEIEVRLTTNVAPVDLRTENIDIAIQFGDRSWTGVTFEYLLADRIAPVCSPRLASLDRPLATLDDLKNHRLLHSQYRKNDWRDWRAAMGRPDLDDHQDGMMFASSLLTYQAAVDGMGIAIGQISLLERELEVGLLICPFDQVTRPGLGYYLLLLERDSIPKSVRLFRDWILDEVRQSSLPIHSEGGVTDAAINHG